MRRRSVCRISWRNIADRWFVLIPILAIPFLKDSAKIVRFVFGILHLHPRARSFTDAVMSDLHSMTANYVRAQLVLVVFAMVAYTLVLVISGVQYGLILGIVAGILEFIPMIGPLIAAVLIVAVAFLTGFHHVWLIVFFLAGWRIVQDYVTSPRLMHRSVKLHPFAVIFAVLAGGEIGGFLGVFLSIPLLAALQIIWCRWQSYRTEVEAESVTHIRAA
jgi:predicted PurR-regulated permease PerM